MKTGRIFLLFFGDIIALIGSFFVTLQLGFLGELTPQIVTKHIFPFTLLYVIWLIVLYLFNLYDIRSVKPTISHLQRIGLALLSCFIVGIVFFYTLPIFNITPRTNLVINIASFALLFMVWRRIFYALFSSGFRKLAVIITKNNTPLARDIEEHTKTHPQSGIKIIGIYADFDACFERYTTEQLDLMITSEPLPNDRIVMKAVYGSQTEVIDLTTAYEQILERVPVTSIDSAWLIHNLAPVKNKLYEVCVDILGRCIAGIILLATLPISLIIAFGIKIQDGGPLFFTHKRVGKNGEPFNFYKFRSMIIKAEPEGAVWTPNKKDSRITRFGSIIRRLHVDEIPQLLNVLKGDMNLVGPRPERPEFVDQLEHEIPHYHLRHIIKPGFTGWAQVKFRYAGSVLESREKFEYDLYYIKNRNIFMDLGIILRTIQIIFTH